MRLLDRRQKSKTALRALLSVLLAVSSAGALGGSGIYEKQRRAIRFAHAPLPDQADNLIKTLGALSATETGKGLLRDIGAPADRPLAANSWLVARISLGLVKVRIIWMLTLMALLLRSTLESMATPFSENAKGRYLMFFPCFKVSIWRLERAASSSLS